MVFFEQIGKRITDVGQSVTQQTKEFVDVTKLNNMISETEKKISKLFLLIGQSYYEKHKEDPAAEEVDKITQINSLYAEIFANREKINQIKGITKCENCGADVPLNATFCSVCGTKVVCKETVNERTGNERRCPACHAIAEDGSLFCKHCGTKIESVNE